MFPYQKELLERALGLSKNEGNKMAQSVLTYNDYVLPCRRLTQVEWASESEKSKREKFTEKIMKRFGNLLSPPHISSKPEDMDPLDFDPRNNDKDDPLGWIDGDPIDPQDNKSVFF